MSITSHQNICKVTTYLLCLTLLVWDALAQQTGGEREEDVGEESWPHLFPTRSLYTQQAKRSSFNSKCSSEFGLWKWSFQLLKLEWNQKWLKEFLLSECDHKNHGLPPGFCPGDGGKLAYTEKKGKSCFL